MTGLGSLGPKVFGFSPRELAWATRLLVMSAALSLAGCGVGLTRREPLAAAEGPKDEASPRGGGAVAEPFGPPRPLPGVDVSSLDESGRKALWEMSNRLYAPCEKEAVTLATCLEEKRNCGACAAEAALLVERIALGKSRTDAAAAAKSRFDDSVVREVKIGSAPSIGPSDAPVTIVVWSDFECPACQAVVPMLGELQAQYGKQVRLVHKNYPLPKHLRAKDAAKAAYAALQQGKFHEMEKLLFENQKTLSDQTLTELAERLKLDLSRWNADRTSEAAERAIAADRAEGDAVGLTHTPFVLVNGRPFDPNFFRYDRDLDRWVREMIEEAAPKK